MRASDFVGAGTASLYSLTVVPRVLAGEPVAYVGDPDAAHGWTYAGDAARTLIAASQDDRAWGRAWHIPSTTVSARELIERLAEVAGAPAGKFEQMAPDEFDQIAAADPIMAEAREMLYLFHQPLILDAAGFWVVS